MEKMNLSIQLSEMMNYLIIILRSTLILEKMIWIRKNILQKFRISKNDTIDYTLAIILLFRINKYNASST